MVCRGDGRTTWWPYGRRWRPVCCIACLAFTQSGRGWTSYRTRPISSLDSDKHGADSNQTYAHPSYCRGTLTKAGPPRVVALSSMGANRTSGLRIINGLVASGANFSRPHVANRICSRGWILRKLPLRLAGFPGRHLLACSGRGGRCGCHSRASAFMFGALTSVPLRFASRREWLLLRRAQLVSATL